MSITTYNLGPMDNNTYLIVDQATGEGALVDPSFDSETIYDDVLSRVTTLKYVLSTHAHFDHVIGNKFYVEKTGAMLALHRNDLELLHSLQATGQRYGFVVEPSPEPTMFLEEGRPVLLGETRIEVFETPGHAPGHVIFVIGSEVIAGDCLFKNSIGRTDLPGGSLQTLLHSISTRLLVLPDNTRVLCGHGDETTIGAERRNNPYLREIL